MSSEMRKLKPRGFHLGCVLATFFSIGGWKKLSLISYSALTHSDSLSSCKSISVMVQSSMNYWLIRFNYIIKQLVKM